MYERHFGFSEKPFNLTPDSRYFFPSPKHQEACANIDSAVRAGGGSLVLTGEIGTGKTTIIRHFLSRLGPDVRTAVILYPDVSAGELFHTIMQDLDVPFAGGSLKDAVLTLGNALVEARAAGLKMVIVIDEAQRLKPHVLEQLRSLSNLGTERERPLTLVLVGQSELLDLLDQPALSPVSPAITSRLRLEPLSLEETRGYLKHRLEVAGGSGSEIEDAAVQRVHALSGGVPRVVNLLCDRALLGAFGHGEKRVTEALVDAAAVEVLPRSPAPLLRVPRRWAEALGLLALGLLLMLPLRYCQSEKQTASVPRPEPTSTPRATPTATAAPSVGVASTAASPQGAPSPRPSASPAPPILAVRCGSVANSRAAAIAAVEGFLGTPGFDSAQATLSFEQWRVLKLPAIARFQSAVGPCEVAVLPVDARTTLVSDHTGQYEMENAKLGEAFLGTAIICFVDRDGVLAKPERARLAWARKVLERRSLIAPGAPDTALSAALTRVGARVGLKNAVSVEGALLSALYSLEGGTLKRSGVSP